MGSILQILSEMETLLRKENSALADSLAEIAHTEDSAEFAAKVTALEVWGGSGSIVDATLRSAVDDRRFNELIVDLAEALDHVGIGTPRSRWVGQIVEDWLIAHPM